MFPVYLLMQISNRHPLDEKIFLEVARQVPLGSASNISGTVQLQLKAQYCIPGCYRLHFMGWHLRFLSEQRCLGLTICFDEPSRRSM